MSLLCSRHSWARARRTRRRNGDGWPDRDRFAAWFQGRAGEACAQVARCRGRVPQTLAGGASRQAGRILSGEGSWARPRQRGSEQAGGRGAWDFVLGAAGTEEAFPGRTGRRPSGERGGAGEGGGRQGGRHVLPRSPQSWRWQSPSLRALSFPPLGSPAKVSLAAPRIQAGWARLGLVAPETRVYTLALEAVTDLPGQRVFARVFGAAIVVLAPLPEIHTRYFLRRIPGSFEPKHPRSPLPPQWRLGRAPD